MITLRLAASAFAVVLCLEVGCSAGGGDTLHSAGSGAQSSSGTASGTLTTGAGGSLLSGGSLSAGSGGPGTDGGRPPRCDDAGKCSCINIASIGLPAHYGANGSDSTDAFVTWLNTKSSASVDLIVAKPTLTPAMLANYDVIILQALEDAETGPFWTFSTDEVTALTTWVNNGGGLITLTGYGGDADEVDPTNQLLSFANISYNKDDILGAVCASPCYCWGSSNILGGWQASSPISANIKQVGAFHGRSINSTDGSVVCTDGTTKYAVSKTVGKGNLFVYCDEWVTYSSQWLGTGTEPPMGDTCYQKSADQIFQVPQFWYNVIKSVAPNSACFDITDPGILK